jgi:antitoxin (DNA-binding transcriptional repressor) of toxin-antitoxin stability system
LALDSGRPIAHVAAVRRPSTRRSARWCSGWRARTRATKFTRDFDTVFASERIETIKTPVREPKAGH